MADGPGRAEAFGEDVPRQMDCWSCGRTFVR